MTILTWLVFITAILRIGAGIAKFQSGDSGGAFLGQLVFHITVAIVAGVPLFR